MPIHLTSDRPRTRPATTGRGRRAVLALLLAVATMALPARPAGAVARVHVDDGRLTITGTSRAEVITVIPGGGGGMTVFIDDGIWVSGDDLSGVHDSVVIDARGGDDEIRLGGLLGHAFPGDVKIYGGAGDDLVRAQPGHQPSISGRFVVHGGADDDVINEIAGLSVSRGASFVSGPGRFHVRVGDGSFGGHVDIVGGAEADLASLVRSELRRGLTATTFGGSDDITLTDTTATSITIDSGGGRDWIDLTRGESDALLVTSGEGDDDVYLEDLTTTATVLTGDGADVVTTHGVQTLGDSSIDTGPQRDRISLNDTTTSSMTIRSGGDIDRVELVEHVGTDDLRISTGDAADLTVISLAQFEGDVRWFGGAGPDRIVTVGSIYGELAHFDGGPSFDRIEGDANIFNPGPLIYSVP